MTVKEEKRKACVADDGTKFDTKSDCEECEAEQAKDKSFFALKAKVDTIECLETECAPFGASFVDDDRWEYRWYRPRTIEEVKALESFFNLDIGRYYEISSILGEWICVEIDGGYEDYTSHNDAYFVDTQKDAGTKFVEFCNKLGFDVTIVKQQSTVTVRDEAIKNMWDELEDIPMNPETECIEEDFYQFPAGTNRKEIWHWFDEQHSKGVNALLN